MKGGLARVRTRRRALVCGAVLGLAAACGWLVWWSGLRPASLGTAPDAPAPLATWPWPEAEEERLYPGVTHWADASSPDGTVLHLFEFNLASNPHLRLELYDQDEDDARPFDNKAEFWRLGVGQATRHLNERGRGPVMAAWNGLFFAYDSGKRRASHVAPVVLNGKAHYTCADHRWTFGVHEVDGDQAFRTEHLPRPETLERDFTFAAGSAECLVREGKPLILHPPPRAGDPPVPQPVPSTPEEAGYIPSVDHLHTSRTSMGWPQDNGRFYLLFVKAPVREGVSTVASRRGIGLRAGWTVADLQRFWLAKGVWGAVNVDGGDVGQMAWLRADGRHELVPPRWASSAMSMTCGPDFASAPQGGTLMYFYVRDASRVSKGR